MKASYHYTNLTVVREYEREVTRSHLTRAKKFSFSSSLDLDVTCSSSLTQLAMALAATGGGAELDRNVGLRAAAW